MKQKYWFSNIVWAIALAATGTACEAIDGPAAARSLPPAPMTVTKIAPAQPAPPVAQAPAKAVEPVVVSPPMSAPAPTRAPVEIPPPPGEPRSGQYVMADGTPYPDDPMEAARQYAQARDVTYQADEIPPPPSQLPRQAPQEIETYSILDAPTPVTSGSTPTSGWAVHLASYRGEATARQGWSALTRKHGTVIAALEPRLSEVYIDGKGRFLRLLAGPFGTREDAASACAAIKASGDFCDVRRFDGTVF